MARVNTKGEDGSKNPVSFVSSPHQAYSGRGWKRGERERRRRWRKAEAGWKREVEGAGGEVLRGGGLVEKGE